MNANATYEHLLEHKDPTKPTVLKFADLSANQWPQVTEL